MKKTIANLLTAFIPSRSKREKLRNELMQTDLSFSLRKGFAEVVAGLTPHKMTRNQWRGILRYGLIRGIGLRWQMPRKKDILPKH